MEIKSRMRSMSDAILSIRMMEDILLTNKIQRDIYHFDRNRQDMFVSFVVFCVNKQYKQKQRNKWFMHYMQPHVFYNRIKYPWFSYMKDIIQIMFKYQFIKVKKY